MASVEKSVILSFEIDPLLTKSTFCWYLQISGLKSIIVIYLGTSLFIQQIVWDKKKKP